MTRCPCLSGLGYDECCGPFHAGTANAPTAERLMRSRYSAYARGLPAYLLATWHPSTRPRDLALDSAVDWYRLDILSRTRGGMLDTAGVVEFRASYRIDGRSDSQRETSTFVRENGLWYYVDGE
ncbi:MAG: YchJ family protein [Salinibacterium sp.]|nr:YchJ family protein [Salinibacterium sp.]